MRLEEAMVYVLVRRNGGMTTSQIAPGYVYQRGRSYHAAHLGSENFIPYNPASL